MAGHSVEEIKRDQKKYLAVGGLLFLFTIITVVVAKFFKVSEGEELHTIDYVIGLVIASIKGGMVALIFMHLKGEKRLILIILAFTLIFFASLFVLLPYAFHNHIVID